MAEKLPETNGYSRIHVAVSAVVGLVVAFLAVWWASGFAVWHEALFRTAPTIEGRGIGTDWEVGNTIMELDLLIALVHAADVIMGVFILLMVFVHWGAFRRFADRMRQPDIDRGEGVVADGGDGDD